MSFEDEGVVELHGEIIGLLGQITAQAERLGDRAPVMGHGAGGGVDGDGSGIFSGVSWATCSISMPPSVETTKATRAVARSTSAER